MADAKQTATDFFGGIGQAIGGGMKNFSNMVAQRESADNLAHTGPRTYNDDQIEAEIKSAKMNWKSRGMGTEDMKNAEATMRQHFAGLKALQ